MLYIKTTDVALGAAMPYKSSMINWNLLNESLSTNGIYSLITNDNAYSSNFYVLQGIIKSGSGTYAISSGYILAQGSVIAVSAATGLTPAVGQTIIGTISDDFTTSTGLGYDPVTFSDGTTHNVHVNQIITWSVGTSGSGDFDYDDLIFLQNPTRQVGTISTAQWDNGSGSTDFKYYKVPFNKLVIDTTLEKLSSGTDPIISLPSGYRPAQDRYFRSFGGAVNKSTVLTFKIDTAGSITLWNTNGTLGLASGDIYPIYAEIPLY